MKTPPLRRLDAYGPPRWEILHPRDAMALVGYTYGQVVSPALEGSRDWDTSCVRRFALLAALFCAGAPWDEIAPAGSAYVEAVLAASAEQAMAHPAGFAVRLMECVDLHFVLGPGDIAAEPLEPRIGELVRAWSEVGLRPERAEDVLMAELHVHAASLRRDPARVPPLPPGIELPRHSLAGAFAHADGAAFAEAVDAAVLGSRDRGTRCAHPGSERFEKRVQGFQDCGKGFVVAGGRGVGAALGLVLPPHAPDAQIFYRS